MDWWHQNGDYVDDTEKKDYDNDEKNNKGACLQDRVPDPISKLDSSVFTWTVAIIHVWRRDDEDDESGADEIDGDDENADDSMMLITTTIIIIFSAIVVFIHHTPVAYSNIAMRIISTFQDSRTRQGHPL